MSVSQALAVDPLWPLKYIGKPWVSGACGPNAYDCWGLLWAVYRNEFGIEIPRYPGVKECGLMEVARLLRSWPESREWEALDAPRHGCAVAMSKGTAFHHVGIWLELDGGIILHAADNRNVVAESLAKLRVFGMNRQAYYMPHGHNHLPHQPV